MHDEHAPRFDPAQARIVLIQAGPRVLPTFPEDLSATIYSCLGIDYTQSISSPEGVRVTLSRGGRPVEQALA